MIDGIHTRIKVACQQFTVNLNKTPQDGKIIINERLHKHELQFPALVYR